MKTKIFNFYLIIAGSFQIFRVESWIFADHEYMNQTIQEWTKQNFRKTAFKKSEATWSAWADHITSNFLRLSSTNFTWSILEYLET